MLLDIIHPGGQRIQLPDQICARCTELESGGRMIDAIVTNTLLPAISREVLSRMAADTPLKKIAITVEDGAFAYDIA